MGLDNFIDVMSTSEFWKSLGSTLIYAFGTMIPCTVLGIIYALVLNKDIPGRSLIRAFIIFPYLVPTVVVTAVFKFMFNDMIGILDHLIVELGLADTSINLFG